MSLLSASFSQQGYDRLDKRIVKLQKKKILMIFNREMKEYPAKVTELKRHITQRDKIFIIPDKHPVLQMIPDDYVIIEEGIKYSIYYFIYHDKDSEVDEGWSIDCREIFRSGESRALIEDDRLFEFVCFDQDSFFSISYMINELTNTGFGNDNSEYTYDGKLWLAIPREKYEELERMRR